MQIRTFLRIMFNDIFHNNVVSKSISALVNFCNEFNVFGVKQLKYSQNVSLNMRDTKKNIFFQSITGDKIDCQ